MKQLDLSFVVDGTPVPKQSFRVRKNGMHFQPRRLVQWQSAVRAEAIVAMDGRESVTDKVGAHMIFYLPDNRHRDLDNLSKGVLDAINGVVFKDDTQVVSLYLDKTIDPQRPGVEVFVFSPPETEEVKE